MSTTTQENTASVLTDREQQAIKNINAVLAGDGSDPESGPGAWGDCGEVDVPVLLDAVGRLSRLLATQTSLSDSALDELEQLLALGTKAPWAINNDPKKWVTNDGTSKEEWTANRDNDAALVVALRNAGPGLVARVRAAESRAYPATLTPELDEVLGWPNFRCAGFADAFRATGHDIGHKAEREQAFVLHWLTGLVLKHGAGWKDAASSDMEALREKIALKEGGQPNG